MANLYWNPQNLVRKALGHSFCPELFPDSQEWQKHKLHMLIYLIIMYQWKYK